LGSTFDLAGVTDFASVTDEAIAATAQTSDVDLAGACLLFMK